MTFNVKDAICTSNPKVEGLNNWCATARIIASFQPDVLLLQECGDNSGNGTGSGVDSVTNLTTVVDRLMTGGSDPFLGGSVTSYVSNYAPGFDMPYVFVSSKTDGFNRNVICSRYPFLDLNSDTKSTYNDLPPISSDEYAPGGTGGIRGVQFVEIDMPDGSYSGDLVVGNMHLKSGFGGDDHDDRVQAAQNTAYLIDYWYNGAGVGTPDPNGRISDNPAATQILDPDTPIVIGGDWNEDEITNGTKGPAEWMTRAEFTAGTDGTDRDRSDMVWDTAVRFFTGSDNTLGSSKLDYIAHQDSVLAAGVETVFDSNSTPFSELPPECVGFVSPTQVSSWASDHRPVICDFSFAGSCEDPETFCVSTGNSSGSSCVLNFSGSANVSANDLTLIASNAPQNVPGLFFYGAGQTFTAFGDGFRCVSAGGVGIFRMPPVAFTDIFGDAVRAVDNTQPPMDSGAGAWTPGSTWYIQYWFRDNAAGGAGFNLSDGLCVTLCP